MPGRAILGRRNGGQYRAPCPASIIDRDPRDSVRQSDRGPPVFIERTSLIYQHAPGRTYRCDFATMAMPTPASEINLIETFADTKVIGLTINHENMTGAEIDSAISRYESAFAIPVTDALTRSPERLVDMVLGAFPAFGAAPTAGAG